MADAMSHETTLVQCLEASDIICRRLEKHEDEMRIAMTDGIRILMQLREASFRPANSIHSSLESCPNDSLDKLGSLHLCSASKNPMFTASTGENELSNKQSFSSAIQGLLMPSSSSPSINDDSFNDLEPPSRISSEDMCVDSDCRSMAEEIAIADSQDDEEDHEVYCICREGSEGDMIACDYEHCSTKWFHMKCVNVSRTPNGNWYCWDCRGGKSNRLKKGL